MGGTVPDDTSTQNRRVQAPGTNNVDETNVLIRIPRADVRPRQRPGFSGLDLMRSIHASIFAVLCRVSSFLRSSTSVDDNLGSLLPPVWSGLAGEPFEEELRGATDDDHARAILQLRSWQKFATATRQSAAIGGG